MAYTLDIGVTLGTSKVGLALQAQYIDSSGADVGGVVTSGFVEIGGGNYLFHASIPDDFRGGIKFAKISDPSTVMAFTAINPEEAERVATLHEEGAVITANNESDGVTIRASVGGETIRIRQGIK